MEIKKLEVGRKINGNCYGCGIDSTTQNMNFTKMRNTSKTMRILDAIIDHPKKFTQDGVIEHAFGFKRPSRAWDMGLFSALHHYGLISYERRGKKFYCFPTEAGIKFYASLEK